MAGKFIITNRKEKERRESLEHPALSQLKGMTPRQAAQWVESSVTSLATAKTVLKILAALLVYLLRNSDLFNQEEKKNGRAPLR